MQGCNEVEPRLQANGTGKSTLWKALTWVLYGKDARGLKAGDVANWEEPKGARVEFDFKCGQLYTIRRTHSPNSWKLINNATQVDLTKDSSNELLSMLRLEYAPFLNCVLLAQDQPMFLDLKPDAKASLFSEIMGLDRWLERSERASRLASTEDSIARSKERECSELKGKLESINTNDLISSKKSWKLEQKDKLTEVSKKYSELLLQSEDLRLAADSDKKAALLLLEKIQPLLRIDESDHDDLKLRRVRFNEEQTTWKINEAEISRLNKLIDHLNSNPECPTCGAAITAKNPALTKAKAQLVKAQINGRSFYGCMKAAELKAQEVEKRSEMSTRTAVEAEKEVSLRQRSAQNSQCLYELAERQLDQLEDQADRIKNEVNPFNKLLQQADDKIKDAEEDLELAERKLGRVIERRDMLTFWVRGFKDLRLKLIAEALEQLAIEVNSCVMALGMVDWELVFEVDRETKSGSIQRGFSVYVRSPHNNKQVPWEAWSGGEAQRLRLATQMGLANLIRSTTGANLKLEVWDEPTSGMSAQGINDLLESLSTRAIRECRQIWVVDHRSLGFGGFAGDVTVVKDEKGSHFLNEI